MKITPKKNRLLTILTTILVLCSVKGLHAQVQWVGDTSSTWSTAANWSPAVAPVAGDTLVFTNAGLAGVSLVNDLPNGTVFEKLTFQTNGAVWSITGNDIGLIAGIANEGDANATINNNIVLGSATNVIGFDGVSAATVNLDGVISDGGNGYGFIKRGQGNLVLKGLNTFTGPIQMNGGKVTFDNSFTNLGLSTNIICGGNSTSTLFDNTGVVSLSTTNGYISNYVITVNAGATFAWDSLVNTLCDAKY